MSNNPHRTADLDWSDSHNCKQVCSQINWMMGLIIFLSCLKNELVFQLIKGIYTNQRRETLKVDLFILLAANGTYMNTVLMCMSRTDDSFLT